MTPAIFAKIEYFKPPKAPTAQNVVSENFALSEGSELPISEKELDLNLTTGAQLDKILNERKHSEDGVIYIDSDSPGLNESQVIDLDEEPESQMTKLEIAKHSKSSQVFGFPSLQKRSDSVHNHSFGLYEQEYSHNAHPALPKHERA